MSDKALFIILAVPVVIYGILLLICRSINRAEGRREPLDPECVDWKEIEEHVRSMAYYQRELLQCDSLHLDAQNPDRPFKLTWDTGVKEISYTLITGEGAKARAFRQVTEEEQADLRELLVSEIGWFADLYDENFRDDPEPPLRPYHIIGGIVAWLLRHIPPPPPLKRGDISDRCRKYGE